MISAGWRGRRAHHDASKTPWSEITTVVTGAVPPGTFPFERRELRPGHLAPAATYALDAVRARGTSFDLSLVHLSVQDATFDECRFTQGPDPASDGGWGQGSLGRRSVVYRRCTFAAVRFELPGGFTTGDATFVDCTFDRCRFEGLFAFEAQFLGCRFVGPVRSATFHGRVPVGRDRADRLNRFEDNDFRSARLGEVALQGGIDPHRQRWPEGIDPDALVSSS